MLATTYGFGSVMSYPLCRDLQEQTRVFDGVFCRHLTTARTVVVKTLPRSATSPRSAAAISLPERE